MTGFYVGAYATAPVTQSWDPEVQTAYFSGLKAIPGIRGLEHPFTGALHGQDDEWFLATIDPCWDFVFTGIPGVMGRLSENAGFGIASSVAAGRQAALAFYEQARQAIHKLNRHLGRQAVKAMMIHTAPRPAEGVRPDVAALVASLEEMSSWDWDGAALVIEHCDTYVEGQTPAKGFLRIEAEIEAVNELNRKTDSNIGLCINWGRSVLEARSVDGPVQHLKAAYAAGLLRGLMFSGVSGADGPYGAWQDTHMPPAGTPDTGSFEASSLLTETEFQRCIDAAGPQAVEVMGIKIGVRPESLTVSERLAYIESALKMLQRAAA
ncbi:DUF4862 family protein [Microbulbifer bruguierae]|uniref:DUF4862 family protein n=1 Tax=Microbulbifer bruguierae TaxID=3029061 RepID=A0ABY8NGF4_9GAMM|nr:DUF4862 family protein [Microbulbifer bruguierae]WGL17893.1 DUF4862 family protein [Microbulbifer bruguierae]